jgi:hypothetical protein
VARAGEPGGGFGEVTFKAGFEAGKLGPVSIQADAEDADADWETHDCYRSNGDFPFGSMFIVGWGGFLRFSFRARDCARAFRR